MTPQNPSFVLGYWRPWKDNSNVIDSYLDYRKDVSLAKYGADIVGKYISQSSKDQISAIKKLNNTFQSGISLISDQLGLVSNQINVVSNKLNKVNDSLLFLNRNMDILIEQQKLNNLLLENIGELLRVPDSEKERQLCIEKGLKHFVNASENLEFYEDSLKYLLKSEEFADDDYFVLHRIGCIYLYAENFINPEKALKYFTRAAKYASVESNPKAIRLANILANNSRSPNSTSTSDLKIIKRIAAESFDKAAFSAYVIGNISLAIENAKKALECYPSAEYYFNLSKYQIRHGDISDGIINLNSAIEKNPTLHYAISQLCDLDLAGENKVHDLLEKLNNHTDEQINSLVFTFNKIEDESSSNIKEINESKHLPYHLKLYKIIEFEETFKKAQNINSEIEKIIDSVQSYSDDNQIKIIVEELRKIKILEFSNDKIKKFENIKADDELRKILKENDELNRLIEENFNLLNKNKSKIAVYEFQTIHDKLIETRKFDIERKYKSLTEINDYINDLIEMNELIVRIETILNKTVFKKPETYRSQLDNILLLPSPKRLSLYRQLLKEINEEKESNNKSNNNADKLKVGSKYAGGIVFYLEQNGINGLVVAEQAIFLAKEYSLVVNHPELGLNTIKMKGHANWGGIGIIGTNKNIGSGKNNTRIIVEKASWISSFFSKKPAPTAARICHEWSHNGFSDWYLPSIEELKLILKVPNIIPLSTYWSSSEDNDPERALYIDGSHFGITVSSMPKDRIANVRAIRSF